MTPYEAATLIQSTFRGHLARLQLAYKHRAATIIQSKFRSYSLRKKYLTVHLPLHRTLASHDARLESVRDRLVRREKEMARLRNVHASRVLEVEKEREWKAAMVIQRIARGWRDRKRCKALRREKWEKEKEERRAQWDSKKSNGGEKSRTSSRSRSSSADSSNSEQESFDGVVRLGRKRSSPTRRKSKSHNKDTDDLRDFGTDNKLINPWEGIPFATSAEGDIEMARREILNRLENSRRSRHRKIGQVESVIPAAHLSSLVTGDSKKEEASNSYWDARDSAAHLIAGLKEVKRLLDDYYDEVDDEYWEPTQPGEPLRQRSASNLSMRCSREEPKGRNGSRLGRKILEEKEEPLRRYKVLPYDLSMGCRALRLSTDRYLNTLLGCIDVLDMDPEEAVPKSLIPPTVLKAARMSHLRSLQDGKMRWWEFEDLEDDDALEEIMDGAGSDIDIEGSTQVY
ncbi:hypothetical protein HDV05_004552 [Chytridiales sp. JEL 0842]|nr:hypothetical protein HDV05_004552 [Chytridiales sp. JEL 0842]